MTIEEIEAKIGTLKSRKTGLIKNKMEFQSKGNMEKVNEVEGEIKIIEDEIKRLELEKEKKLRGREKERDTGR